MYSYSPWNINILCFFSNLLRSEDTSTSVLEILNTWSLPPRPSQEAVNVYSKLEASFDVYELCLDKDKDGGWSLTPITHIPLEGPHGDPRGRSRAGQAHEVGRANAWGKKRSTDLVIRQQFHIKTFSPSPRINFSKVNSNWILQFFFQKGIFPGHNSHLCFFYTNPNRKLEAKWRGRQWKR